ncbi:MAG: hypothetical protein ABSB29_03360 [Nitrososphaerales archaeon]
MSGRSRVRTSAVFVLLLFALPILLSASFIRTVDAAVPAIPSGVLNYVPIELTNSQASAVAGGTQVPLTVDWSSLSTYLNAQSSNVVFFDDAGNPLHAWMETFAATSDVADMVWVQLNSTGIPASSARTIYMGLYSTSTNNFNPNGNWGEAPTITATYGQYDNGAQVFAFYDNFAGTTISSAWNTTGAAGYYTVDNGVILYSDPIRGAAFSLVDQYTGPLIADAYQASTYGAWSGVSFSNLQTNGPASYGSGAIQWVYPPQGPYSGYVGVCINSGCTSFTPNPPSTTLQVDTLAVGSTTSTGYQDYANPATVSGTISLRNYPGLIAVAYSTSDTLTAYWFRLRAYPPNNVMPSVSFGSTVTPLLAGDITPASPTISSGDSVTLTANPAGGIPPYTSYQWYTGPGCTNPISNATSSTYDASPSVTTTYYYQVSDSNAATACSAGDTVTVTPSPPIPAFPFPFAIPVVLAATALIYVAIRKTVLGGQAVPAKQRT